MNNTVSSKENLSSCFLKPQPSRKDNIDAFVSYFRSGIKPQSSLGELGIELEHTIVQSDGISPVSYREDKGVAWLLGQLSQHYPVVTSDEEGDILGVARDKEAVTIEPSAQVELSAGPFSNLKSAQRTFEAFENLLESTLAPVGKKVLTYGYHPTARARDLELIPKKRYQFMNTYLEAKDTCGPCMMRASASTQISIDYTSEADCLRKLRIAYALVPLLSLICDNTIYFEGTKREHQLIRTHIWNHVDNDRCGLIPGIFDPEFTLADYASYILDTPAILTPCKEKQWCYSEKTFGEIYKNKVMNRPEVEHAASMLFNDVRLKTYIEIRPADALPIPYVIAYASLIKGLFYSSDNLDELEKLFANVRSADFSKAKTALMRDGYRACVYGAPISELCDNLVEKARKGLSEEERTYLEPLAHLIANKTTLANLAEEKLTP